MNLKSFYLLIISVFHFTLCTFSQQSSEVKKQLSEYFEQATHYKEILLYGESIGELNKVIKLANLHGYQKEIIKASIAKAELFRRTESFDRGIELLYQLKNTEKHPKLHVQKLGRLAALYAENGAFSKTVQRDSIKAFVEEGIAISTRLGLKEEEASLRNELGFSQSRNQEFDIALQNLTRAKNLFNEIKDKENEMGAHINILDLYVSKHDFKKCDSLYPRLVKEIKQTNWFAAQSKLYSIISIRYKADEDTINELQWAERSHGATVSQVRLINSNQMASFKVIHDTNQFKEEALHNSIDLERQKSKTQQLILFIFILILIIVIVILIFFREKRLKYKLNNTVGDLNVMNEKYEMLIIESNHRIKNNLQMIISMLEFTKKGMKNSDTDVVQSMSGKIQTISALHKYLYVDVHNEHVSLNTYFAEILTHYENIGLKHELEKSISSLKIKSERIVYFGLILNEMLSNTLKHGNSSVVKILLNVEVYGDHFLFTYSDGSPHQETSKKGTGTKLIKQLVDRIKGSNYQILQENGTYHFEFHADKAP